MKRAEFDRLEIRETVQPEDAPARPEAAPPAKLGAVEAPAPPAAGPFKPERIAIPSTRLIHVDEFNITNRFAQGPQRPTRP